MSEDNSDTPFHPSPAPKWHIPGRPRPRQNIAQQIKAAAEERGALTEKRFFTVIRSYLDGGNRSWILPQWFYGVEKAAPRHDRKGVDAFVLTDVGKIPVQIKSSMAGAKQFSNKQCHEGIVVIVINKNITDEKILTKTRTFVSRFHQKVIDGLCKIKDFEE